jgi:hypothetical protein
MLVTSISIDPNTNEAFLILPRTSRASTAAEHERSALREGLTSRRCAASPTTVASLGGNLRDDLTPPPPGTGLQERRPTAAGEDHYRTVAPRATCTGPRGVTATGAPRPTPGASLGYFPRGHLDTGNGAIAECSRGRRLRLRGAGGRLPGTARPASSPRCPRNFLTVTPRASAVWTVTRPPPESMRRLQEAYAGPGCDLTVTRRGRASVVGR